MNGENEGRSPGVLASGGQYWREQRRFMLRNLKDFGFGKASMENLIQDEVLRLCSRLCELPEVNISVSLIYFINPGWILMRLGEL